MTYDHSGKPWRVERPAELLGEFSLAEADLPAFHAVACRQSAAAWRILRRLYGVQPLGFSDASAVDAEDMRLWSIPELTAALGITRKQLQAELASISGAWKSARARQAPAPAPAAPVSGAAAAGMLDLRSDAQLLAVHGLAEAAPPHLRGWLMERVTEMRKVLDQPNLQMFGRELILTELALRQLTPGVKGYASDRKELLELYQSQLEQLQALAPWAGAVAGGVKLSGALADLTRAFCEYQSTGDTRLADGIFTATEIRIELRRSEQLPEPRYRPGLVAHLNSAREGLFDPTWKPPFKNHELARVDKAFAAALIAAHEASGAPPIPNLESTGPSGEYEPVL